jgi:hypothetical protein
MDNSILKKKLSAFVTDKGYVKGVPDDALYEILVAWEQWPGPGKEFYRSLGLTPSQVGPLLGKAKKLKREGRFGEGEFTAVRIDSVATLPVDPGPCAGAEIVWTNGRVIRFSQVDLLLDFLKKSA